VAKETVALPVIANGDINSVETFAACQKETGVSDFMIGRAALSNPYLFNKIKASQELFRDRSQEWSEIEKRLVPFFESSKLHVNGYFATSRTKQWLKHLALQFPEGQELFQRVKTAMKPEDFRLALGAAIGYSGRPDEAIFHEPERVQGRENL
jgi:tRNA-dihydrouridine synthase C